MCGELPLIQGVPQPVRSAPLQATLERVVTRRVETNRPRLAPEQVRVAVIDLADPQQPLLAEHRGTEPVYPASVVKMFYMGCAYHLAREGKISLTPRLRNRLYEMMHASSNLATAWVLDRLSGVEHDAAMNPEEYAEFAHKRNVCNRWLRTLGFTDVNANQKTWVTPIPPGEQQFLRDGRLEGPYTNRNAMSALAAARYLQLIAQDALVDAEACRDMRRLMLRDPGKQRYQRRRIAGGAPKGAKVFAKSGTTTQTFHDAGIVTLADGRSYILVVLVTGKGSKGAIIRDISADLGRHFEGGKAVPGH